MTHKKEKVITHNLDLEDVARMNGGSFDDDPFGVGELPEQPEVDPLADSHFVRNAAAKASKVAAQNGDTL